MSTKLDIAVVDLFCGAGGLSLGLRQSGLRIAAGIDLDRRCQFPFEANVKSRFLRRDVSEISASELNQLFGNAKIRVLAACAPCQPFSGYTSKRRALDERWKLLLEILRFASANKPEVITVENVSRLAKLPLWAKFVQNLRLLHYNVTWSILDASDYGVPQRRKRVVLLASRLGPIALPKPISMQPVTVRASIEMLPKIESGRSDAEDTLHCARGLTEINLKRIRASKPASTWRTWPKNLVTRCHSRNSGRTYPSVYGRMSWDEPAPTITTQFYGYGNGRFGHPDQDRAISLREGAILQSFPRNFAFVPQTDRINFNAIGRLIGNAVPPKLARAIGRSIITHAAAMAGGVARNSSASR